MNPAYEHRLPRKPGVVMADLTMRRGKDLQRHLREVGQCPHCRREMEIPNMRRHVAACAENPINAAKAKQPAAGRVPYSRQQKAPGLLEADRLVAEEIAAGMRV